MFIFALILVVIGIIALIGGFFARKAYKKEYASYETKVAANTRGYGNPDAPSRALPLAVLGVGAGFAVLGLVFLLTSSFYTQDAGESVLQKDITGNIVGSTTETGLHVKAPWVDTTVFNIRNQQVVFSGGSGSDSKGDNTGGEANGPQITAQDRDGVTSNLDIALRYSIKPTSVTEIYKQFKTEDNFKKSFIEQDVRSVVRSAPNKFHTLDLLTKRGDVENTILAALQKRWAKTGVTVDSISLQEIRAPKSVTESYAQAQQAQINVSKEQAKLDAAKVSAQQKVVQAQAEADANAKLNASLTPQILQQRYLDTLKELAAAGNVVMVPENGASPLVSIGK